MHNTGKRGFVLLIAVIFMSVMLSFGVALGALGYKQQVLASSALESQHAFYAADSALECLLYADQRQNLYEHPASEPPSAPSLTCDNASPISSSIVSYSASSWVVTSRLSLDSGTRCADITIYKPDPGAGTTYLFSEGYSASCTTVASPGNARLVSRGVSAQY